jgi:hypothetical protein
MMQTSESLTKIAPALLAAQKAIGVAHKTASNPYFKSSYANLEAVIGAVKGPLNDNDVVFLQAVQSDERGASVGTILLHISGEFIISETPVRSKDDNDPQKMGSGITYAKRYALQAICGLPTEDDDGNAAAKPPKKPVKPPKKPVKPAKEIDADTVTGAREELTELLDEHKISEADQGKWLKHFKIKTLGDLKYEDLEKVIAGVKKKYAK